MQNKNGKLFYGECINAFLQGYFDNQKLEAYDQLNGTGIVLDDQLNFFLSEYCQSKLNGPSFMRTSAGHMIYGNFKQNRPVNVIGVSKGEYRIYLSVCSQKSNRLVWRKEATIINTQNNLLYVLEINEKKEKANFQDMSEKFGIQNINIEKNMWKIKILDRCILKSDWKLLGYSKLINNLKKQKLLQFKNSQYTVHQQNIIPLVSSILGSVFNQGYMISPYTFLRHFQAKNYKLGLYQMQESQDSKEDVLFITTNQNNKLKKINKSHKKQLGFLLRRNSYTPLALGHFDSSIKLNGFGAYFGRNKYSVGLFKQNMMTKEYSYVEGEHKKTNAYQLRQLLSQQHLKAINYIHNSHFIPQVTDIVSIANKIIKYVVAFQKQYEKRHLSYNDTFAQNSMSSQYINVLKYVEQEQKNSKFVEQDINKDDTVFNTTWRSSRKPGFIVNKRDTSSSPIPTQRIQANSKSPLRQIRMKGKISSKSPTDKKNSPLKTNVSTIRRGAY